MSATTSGTATAGRTGRAGRAPSPRARSGSGAGRVAGIDVVRGLLLVASVVTSSLVAAPQWFDHAEWIGVHPLDLVFPAFVVLTGAGLGFAHKNGVRVPRLVRRVVVLLLVGLAYNAAIDLAYNGSVSLQYLRWTGVLQLYAAIVLAIALLHLVVKSWSGWLVVSVALAAVNTVITSTVAFHCPDGLLTPQCNPSLSIDGALFPVAHLYQQLSTGNDPEGLVSLLGACATAAAGTAVAHALTASRRTSTSTLAAVPRLLVVAAVLAAAAFAATPVVPAMKHLWTAPFGLGVAAGVVVVIAVVHVLVDAPWVSGDSAAATVVRGARWPFVALGRNSLLVYFASHVLMVFLLVRPLASQDGSVPNTATRVADALSWVGTPQVGLSALLLAFWWGLAVLLHRRGWYVRA